MTMHLAGGVAGPPPMSARSRSASLPSARTMRRVVHTGMRAGSWSGTLPVRQSTRDDSDSPRSNPPPGRMISPTDDPAAAESSISASGPPVPSPRAGIDKDHRRPGGPTPCPGDRDAGQEWKSHPESRVRPGRPGIEGSNRFERQTDKSVTPTGKGEPPPTPAARRPSPGRSRTGRPGVLQPEGGGPDSLPRADRDPRLRSMGGDPTSRSIVTPVCSTPASSAWGMPWGSDRVRGDRSRLREPPANSPPRPYCRPVPPSPCPA